MSALTMVVVFFGICNNHNSIGIEMCVQAGYNYDKAFRNTVEICKMLMQKFGIDADHVVSHYDVCAKELPFCNPGKR